MTQKTPERYYHRGDGCGAFVVVDRHQPGKHWRNKIIARYADYGVAMYEALELNNEATARAALAKATGE